jgi:toxin-antitoxin system PIN domain toxin
VIAVDTNILVYAHRSELPQHRSALAALTALAEGRARWGIPVFCLGEWLRVITHPRLFSPPNTVDEATAALERVLASPSLEIFQPGAAYPHLLAEAMRKAAARGNLVYDAQIVALCGERGVRSPLTEDRDFARFSGFSCTALGPMSNVHEP